MDTPDPKLAALEEMLAKYGSPLSARDKPAYLKSLLYGDYKVGKTVVACKCGRRPLLFATDPGWVSLKDWPELADKVEVIECQGLRHYEAFVKGLANDIPIYREFDHVILDPWSKLVDMYLDWLQDNVTPSTADARVQWNTKSLKTDPTAAPFTTAGMGDYQAVRNHFRRSVYPLLLVQKHVTLIAHLREPSFLDNVKTLRSSVPGKTHEMIAREVDVIGLMEAEGEKRTISFIANSRQDAGARFRELHGRVINADDLPLLYKKWDNK